MGGNFRPGRPGLYAMVASLNQKVDDLVSKLDEEKSQHASEGANPDNDPATLTKRTNAHMEVETSPPLTSSFPTDTAPHGFQFNAIANESKRGMVAPNSHLSQLSNVPSFSSLGG